MRQVGEPVGLLDQDLRRKGFERRGDDHVLGLLEGEALEEAFQDYLQGHGIPEEALPQEGARQIWAMLANRPFIEGPWVTKHQGTYYLQYAAPGTEYNGYGDGVYISKNPLGPYHLAANNPYSYKPGGFITGAGHGSTMQDLFGNWWHISTMRISVNHNFERRIGLWPAGFDEEGEFFVTKAMGTGLGRYQEAKSTPGLTLSGFF